MSEGRNRRRGDYRSFVYDALALDRSIKLQIPKPKSQMPPSHSWDCEIPAVKPGARDPRKSLKCILLPPRLLQLRLHFGTRTAIK